MTDKILEFDSYQEMANYGSDRTGLKKGVIAAFFKDSNHAPSIKYYRTKPSSGESVSITISDEPKIKEEDFKLTSQDKKEIFQFIKLNKKALLYFWNHADEILDSGKWADDNIKSI